MRKTTTLSWLLLLAAFCLPGSSIAQEGEPATSGPGTSLEDGHDPIHFLFRAGATWADLRGRVEFDGDGAVPFEGDFGFVVGGGVEIHLVGNFSVQPEVLIVRRFAQVGGVERKGPQSKLSSHYLELPVNLKWFPGGRRGTRGNVIVGVVPGLLLGATREIRDGNRIEDVEARELLADLDWSLAVGGGFEFTEAFANFTVDVRYVHGFTDMNAAGSPVTARWSTIQLITGVVF